MIRKKTEYFLTGYNQLRKLLIKYCLERDRLQAVRKVRANEPGFSR